MSHKRVLIVLASLVATLTLSAGFLLALEGVTGAGPTMSSSTDVELREKPWDFIIVYQSGDVAASAADLAEGRLKGGNGNQNASRPGANFHFVVDSAKGVDGGYAVVRGSAWQAQKAGAPNVGWPANCNNTNVYTNAVGICFAGDIIKAKGTNQVQELTKLVSDLRHKLNIPPERVKFQWEPLEKGSPLPTKAQQEFADNFRKGL